MTSLPGSPPTSLFSAWLLALRPRAYPATISPVILASTFAYAQGNHHWGVTLVALLCAMLMQTASNFINDIYDHRKGADTSQRLGAPKVISLGLISERSLIFGTILAMSTAFFLGLYLVWIGGWPIFAIGVLSLIAAWAYTGGPYPLAYHALGDLTVIVFYGVAAVSGTYYVHHLAFSWDSVWLGLACGVLASNILGVNNLRDIPTDRLAGKTTLSLLIGERGSVVLYTVQFLVAVGVSVYFLVQFHHVILLLPFVIIPLGVVCIKEVATLRGKALNPTLAKTAATLLLYGALQSLSFYLVASF